MQNGQNDKTQSLNSLFAGSFCTTLKADFHLVAFSDWTVNPLFTCENVAMILNRMSRVTNILLSKNSVPYKIQLSGNQP